MANIVGMEKSILEVEASGAVVEGVGALAAVVLAILGIIGLVPVYMAAIASIVIGAALLAQAAAVAGEYTRLLSQLSGGAVGAVELGAGMTAEFAIGGSAVTLGILSLVGIHPLVLLPCSIIAIGAALILTVGTTTRLNDLKLEAAEAGALAQSISRAAVSGAAGVQVLAGFAAAVLGIIALVSITPVGLTLVGFLVSGAAMALSATALSGKMLQTLQRSGSAPHGGQARVG